jgi:Ca2+-binding RTX toxin-like protein
MLSTSSKISAVNGTDAPDVLFYDQPGHAELNGGDGDDQIYGGFSQAWYIDPGAGMSFVIYTPIVGAGGYTINGGSGNDFIWVAGDNNTVNAGSGNDSVFVQDVAGVGPGNNVINLGDGNDFLIGSAGADTINGGAGDDYINGGGGSDMLIGGPGADSIFALAGDAIHTDSADMVFLWFSGPEDLVGTIALHGATTDTHFDFSAFGPSVQNPDGLWTRGITTTDLSFDSRGNLHVDVTQTGVHDVISGMPFDDMAGLQAEVAAGTVVLVHSYV